MSVLLISGPAGAGKSEFAERWASTRSYRCARVTPDEVWDLIKSGRADAVDGWSEEHRRQHELTLDGTAGLVSTFLRNEVSVVVDDVVFPEWPESGLEAWERRLPSVALRLVLLMPSWNVIVRRNAERSGRDNLPGPVSRKIFDDMNGWREQSQYPVIDNGEMTVDETVERVERLLGE